MIQSRLRHRLAGGFSLITAIFLLVVMSGLVGLVINLVNSQQKASSLDVLGVRAYQAARAGIEWGLYQKPRNDSCSGATPVTMPAGTTLSGFTVIVTCTRLADIGPAGLTQTGITATRTASSPVLTGMTNTAAMVQGMRVFGAGIAPGAIIININSATSVTLSNMALTSGTTALNFYSPLDQWDLTSIACNLPTSGQCNNASNNADYVQRRMQVRF
jgi:MSHA biogenesis protein MshP